MAREAFLLSLIISSKVDPSLVWSKKDSARVFFPFLSTGGYPISIKSPPLPRYFTASE